MSGTGINFHRVTSIYTSRSTLANGAGTRKIVVVDDEGESLEIDLFAEKDNPQALNIMEVGSATIGAMAASVRIKVKRDVDEKARISDYEAERATKAAGYTADEPSEWHNPQAQDFERRVESCADCQTPCDFQAE